MRAEIDDAQGAEDELCLEQEEVELEERLPYRFGRHCVAGGNVQGVQGALKHRYVVGHAGLGLIQGIVLDLRCGMELNG